MKKTGGIKTMLYVDGEKVAYITNSVKGIAIEKEWPLSSSKTFTVDGYFSQKFQIYKCLEDKIYLRNIWTGNKLIANIIGVKNKIKKANLKSGYKHGSIITGNYTIQ